MDSPLISFKCTLEYKGTHYHGFQYQNDQKTIQGELNQVLQQMVKSDDFKTLGSGRTDAGVHALEQIVKIDLPLEMNGTQLMRALNAQLPRDIRVKDCVECKADFHPILHAEWKEYLYLFTTRRDLSCFEADAVVSCPYDFHWEMMDKVCEAYKGEHDFQNYFCVGTQTPSTVRTIYECQLDRRIPEGRFEQMMLGGDYFAFRVRGSGFLKQMVRLMVSVLWNVGRGKVDFETFKRSLSEPMTQHLAPVAPPQGLYLAQVSYRAGKF